MDLIKFVDKVNGILWDNVLIFVLMGTGIFYTLYLGLPQFTKIGRAFKHTFGGVFSKRKETAEGEMSSFQALATAIAAQVGTGNLAGVASAIAAGGPGAIFWMWVSAFFGMSTIFGEAVLAQKYNEKIDGETTGGPAYYLSKGVNSKFLASTFAVLIIIALGFVGNMVQSNSIADAVHAAFGINKLIIGIIVAICAGAILIGGVKRIASFAELVVPFMAILYILGGLVIMAKNGSQILPAFKSIFVGAFSPQALGGGLVGVTVKESVRYGIARGLFSNEAGMGSTPHAHAVAKVNHPAEQGMVAMVGVVIDTLIICTFTALVNIVTGANTEGLDAAAMTQRAFEIGLGRFGVVFIAVSLFFFAFTTIIGWTFFGDANIKYLFGKKGSGPYKLVVLVFIVLGSTLDVKLVWKLADMFNGLMVIPNIIGLLILAPQVRKLVTDYNENYSRLS
ncbi:alanine/glycine:cation symporter family protein [Tissierella creatinophila]|uniref:Amino-acid carrier protein AlsT n=1 Tax=Tissierella creatinophila DSM 6911 TaxID=1123403 RepID=A0A1U7M7Y2_TISCR|nr:sodium:alanine symporter family protein [Tissierella creatinophila]OLS03407.1 amino-acid carrier protein AlsT [Tissierella creatinophila DSM 6911]